jgi:alginate O-acetyltransferase complex protein AlgI
MSFLSITYGLFLLSVLGIYWTLTQEWLRLWTLLIASLVFYASLQVQYIPLLLALAFINYRLGVALGENTSWGPHALDAWISNEDWQFAQADWNRRRFKVLWLGIILNVVVLLVFKYFSFLITVVFRVSPDSALGSFRLLAPLGISFFTFECIAYLVDVYRGAPATKDFVKFATYKFFFTKLISGPITRYHTLVTQLGTIKFPTADIVADGLWLIARGAVKKGLLADHLGIFVDICFRSLERAGSGDLWLAIAAYGFQLYLDFSGYVDIARGTAMLFGLILPENFDSPYFTTSIADFWRRWHITLGDWLRNYLYFPLGGSRGTLARTCWNLMIVMLIAGIWHGGSGTRPDPTGYLVWGAYHGLALVVHRITQEYSRRTPALFHFWQNPIGILIAWLLTQVMVFTSWIFFRLPNFQDFSLVLRHLWGHQGDAQFAQKVYIEALNISPYQITVLILALAAVMTVIYMLKTWLKLQINWPLKLLFVPICLYTVWVLAPQGSLPYIYFDF